MAEIRVVEQKRGGLAWLWLLLLLVLVAAVVWFVLGANADATVETPTGTTTPASAAPATVDSVSLQGYPTVYGLAGWEGLIVAFNSGGELIKVDPVTKMVTVLADKNITWWGAGVGTVIPQ